MTATTTTRRRRLVVVSAASVHTLHGLLLRHNNSQLEDGDAFKRCNVRLILFKITSEALSSVCGLARKLR